MDFQARQAGHNEAFGLLASPPGELAITRATLMDPCDVSGAHCEVAPTEIRRWMLAFQREELVPRGTWHSHGLHAPFISGQDNRMAHCLFPAFATRLYRRV